MPEVFPTDHHSLGHRIINSGVSRQVQKFKTFM